MNEKESICSVTGTLPKTNFSYFSVQSVSSGLLGSQARMLLEQDAINTSVGLSPPPPMSKEPCRHRRDTRKETFLNLDS